MEAALVLSSEVGIKPACEALEVSRAGFYRMQTQRNAPLVEPNNRPSPPRALSLDERQGVLDILHTERFVDKAPYEVYATLLDEGQYHCSIRTMYRILDDNKEVKERRNQLSHPMYQKPELLATAPNQVWSWDITKLLGPAKWTYFYLYVIMDIFSRYVVGWMIAPAESAVLAEKLIEETCAKQNIGRGQLTIHADRGSSMKSKPVALLLSDLGSQRPTAGHIRAMITPIQKPSSKPSNIVRTFLNASVASRTPGVSVRFSFRGTTKSIGTPASACSRRKLCITALQRTCR